LDAIRVLGGVLSFLVCPLLEIVWVFVVPLLFVQRPVRVVTNKLLLPVTQVCLMCPAHPRSELITMLLGCIHMTIRQLLIPLGILALSCSKMCKLRLTMSPSSLDSSIVLVDRGDSGVIVQLGCVLIVSIGML